VIFLSEPIFINPKNWKSIKRGYFYQAAMYYLSDTEQPLRFVERNDDSTYSIDKRIGNFDPIIVDGRPRAVEQDVIVTVKPRQVIILSNNNMNQSQQFEYIQVLPVFSLSRAETFKPWYKDLLKDEQLGFAYINNSRHGLRVDLTQVSTIHKSMLLKEQREVPEDRMRFIESHILELLDL